MDNPLPKSSQNASKFILQFKAQNINFQKELVDKYNEIEYYLEY